MRSLGVRERLPEDPEDFRATLAEHLDEFRFRLVRVAIALCVATGAGWFLYKPVFNHLMGIVQRVINTLHAPVTIVFKGVTEAFMLQLKLSFYIGLVIALPYIVYELWMFIRPALRKSEVKPFKTVVPASLFLFALGAWLGYMVYPPTIRWFIDFAMGQSQYVAILENPYDIILLAVKMMLVFGISFQLPLIVFFLAKVGIISPDFLWRYWKHCTVGVFTAVAVFSPTADPFSMVALALPLSVLVFGSILAAKISFGKKGSSELDRLD